VRFDAVRFAKPDVKRVAFRVRVLEQVRGERAAVVFVFVATPPAAPDEVAAALKCYVGIIVSPMVPGAGGYELKRDCRSSPGYAAIDQHLPSYRASWNKRTGQPV
jgi:hypothetical protein